VAGQAGRRDHACAMRPSDLDPTARSRRAHDVCAVLAGAEEEGGGQGLPASGGGVDRRKRVGGVGVRHVDVLAALGHDFVSLLGGVCVTSVVGASPSSSPRCRSARQRYEERVRGCRGGEDEEKMEGVVFTASWRCPPVRHPRGDHSVDDASGSSNSSSCCSSSSAERGAEWWVLGE
jgi:hypothetical protein